MQGSFYGVIPQTAFPDSAVVQRATSDGYMQFFPTITGSTQSDETTPSSIMQLGSMQYPGAPSISSLHSLQNLANVAQPSAISTIPLQPLRQVPSTNFGTNGMVGMGALSTISTLPNMWPSGIYQGPSSTVSSLQQGMSCYPYLPNNVVSKPFSHTSKAVVVENRYGPSRLFVPDSPTASASDEDSTTKVDTHRRLPASDWRKIMDMHKEDKPIKDIMSRFGVSRSQVYRIIRLKGIKPNNRDENKRLGRPKGLNSKEIEQIRQICKDRNVSLTRMLDELITSKTLPRIISVSTLSRILRSPPADD